MVASFVSLALFVLIVSLVLRLVGSLDRVGDPSIVHRLFAGGSSCFHGSCLVVSGNISSELFDSGCIVFLLLGRGTSGIQT